MDFGYKVRICVYMEVRQYTECVIINICIVVFRKKNVFSELFFIMGLINYARGYILYI